jgi:hypothetical protein
MMRSFLSALCLVAYLYAQPVLAEECHGVPVTDPYPLLLGNDTAIIRLVDGSLWLIYPEHDYIYGNDPQIMICSTYTFLIVRDKVIDAQMLLAGEATASASPAPPADLTVVESRIVGNFTGWDGETTFILMNGQKWQQAPRSFQSRPPHQAYVGQHIYEPKVLIIPIDGNYELFVEGLDQRTRVQKLH